MRRLRSAGGRLLTIKAKNKSGAQKAIGDNAKLLTNKINTAAAAAGEVDLLGGLDLAARAGLGDTALPQKPLSTAQN